MKYLHFWTVIILLCFGNIGYSQYKPQYSLYSLNGYLLNPGITGIENYTDVKIGYRNQWTGIEGAPTTLYLSGHTSLGKKLAVLNSNNPSKPNSLNAPEVRDVLASHHGVGASLIKDDIGPFSNVQFHLNYAYHLSLTKNINLSAGISAGLEHNQINLSELVLTNPIDNFIQDLETNRTNLDMALGLLLYSDRFYIGFSANGFNKNFQSVQSNAEKSVNYFASGGYRFPASNDVSISLNTLLKWIYTSDLLVDVNAKLGYKDKIWGGLGYRNSSTLIMMVGLNVSYMFDLGYSYDFAGDGFTQYSSGSHEIVLGFKLNNKRKLICPQNLW